MSVVIPFASGIISFVSPCIIPMITVYLTLITGMTIDELSSNTNSKNIKYGVIFNTLLFITGFSLIFILAGSTAGYIGHFLKEYNRILNKIGGILVILFGLHLSGIMRLNILCRMNIINKFSLSKKPIGYLGAAIVGIFFAVVCSHCIGPLLFSMLVYAGTTASPLQGMVAMALYSTGLAIPYMITAIAVTRTINILKKIKQFLWLISLTSGLLMVIFGYLMFIGKFTLLTEFFSRIIPFKIPGGM